MIAVVDPVTLACAVSFVFFSVYTIALGIYGFMRTGFAAFFLLIVASAIGLAVSIANVALVYDSYIGMRLLGRGGWQIFYYVFYSIQPIGSLLTAVAMTMLTVWIMRRSHQPFEPTAGRCTEKVEG